MLDVPDSEANAAAFIRPRNRNGAGGAFPKVRLMTLVETGIHAVIDAVFGPQSEQVLASRLLAALRPGMLLLGDRNSPSWRLWAQATTTGAHLLWRVKNSKLLPRIGTFADGDRRDLQGVGVSCAEGRLRDRKDCVPSSPPTAPTGSRRSTRGPPGPDAAASRPSPNWARRITRQRDAIHTALLSGLSNARTESVNTRSRLIIRRGFGFHSAEAIIALAMLQLGGHRPALPGRT